MVGDKLIAGHLVATDVGTEHDKAFAAFGQALERFGILNLEFHSLSSEHRETVDDNLRELDKVEIGVPKGLELTLMPQLAKIAVGIARTSRDKHADGDDENCGKRIIDAYVAVPQHTDKPSVHAVIAESVSLPVLLHHGYLALTTRMEWP